MSTVYMETGKAFNMISDLAEDLDEQSFMTLLESVTRPIFHLKVPAMERLCREDAELEARGSALRDMKIGDMIQQQNLPIPDPDLEGSELMRPTAALAAAIFYFLHWIAQPTRVLSQDNVADMFFMPRSTFHRIVSGKRNKGRLLLRKLAKATRRSPKEKENPAAEEDALRKTRVRRKMEKMKKMKKMKRMKKMRKSKMMNRKTKKQRMSRKRLENWRDPRPRIILVSKLRKWSG